MVKINWTQQAIDDLVSIAEFIGRDSKKYARLTVQNIRNTARKLKHFPFSGKETPEFEKNKTRELVYGNYRIFYLICSEKQIDILTIHHSSRPLNVSL